MLESKMCCGRKKTESRVRDMRGTGVRPGRSRLHHYGLVRGTERQHISRLKGEEGLSQRSCAGSTLHAVGTARAQAQSTCLFEDVRGSVAAVEGLRQSGRAVVRGV